MTSAALNATFYGKRRLSAATQLVGDAIQIVGKWRSKRRTIRTLMALDDYSLKDIGLHRSEIPSLASHLPVRRRPQ